MIMQSIYLNFHLELCPSLDSSCTEIPNGVLRIAAVLYLRPVF
jgi:hypothetical protein